MMDMFVVGEDCLDILLVLTGASMAHSWWCSSKVVKKASYPVGQLSSGQLAPKATKKFLAADTRQYSSKSATQWQDTFRLNELRCP